MQEHSSKRQNCTGNDLGLIFLTCTTVNQIKFHRMKQNLLNSKQYPFRTNIDEMIPLVGQKDSKLSVIISLKLFLDIGILDICFKLLYLDCHSGEAGCAERKIR